MRKSFAFLALICLISFGCRNSKHSIPDHITLTWAGDPHTTQTITWRTDTTEKQGDVRFTEDSLNFESNATIFAQIDSGKFITDIGTWYLHTVAIKNLVAGRKYYYKVGYGDNYSAISSFRTEDTISKTFSFLIFGDSQSGAAKDTMNYSFFDSTIHHAFRAYPDAKFFINMGDLVEIGGYYHHWNNWFKAAKGVIDRIPIMPVVGNHETYQDSLEIKTEAPKYFKRQFVLPLNDYNDLQGEVYSYDYGNVHFIVLNSQFNEKKEAAWMRKEEEVWLKNDLEKNKDKKWKIVMFHKPPYYNKSERSNDTVKAVFQPIIDKYHVDLVINGHDHGIEWTYPIKDDRFYNRPSKGTIYLTAGRSGNKSYSDLKLKVWNATPLDANLQKFPNYISAKISDDKLILIAKTWKGDFEEKLIIDKKNDTIIQNRAISDFTYNTTRLVVFGYTLPTSVKPLKKDNIWYIPAKAFIKFFKQGDCFATGKDSMMLKIYVNGNNQNIGEFEITEIDKTEMISAKDIELKFGFTCKYDKAKNMLMFCKDSKE